MFDTGTCYFHYFTFICNILKEKEFMCRGSKFFKPDEPDLQIFDPDLAYRIAEVQGLGNLSCLFIYYLL